MIACLPLHKSELSRGQGSSSFPDISWEPCSHIFTRAWRSRLSPFSVCNICIHWASSFGHHSTTYILSLGPGGTTTVEPQGVLAGLFSFLPYDLYSQRWRFLRSRDVFEIGLSWNLYTTAIMMPSSYHLLELGIACINW
jgi:hypothetical protein